MRVEKLAIKSACSAASGPLAREAALAADFIRASHLLAETMRQAFWPPSLQMCARSIQNVCLAHQERKSTHRFQGLPVVSGPHWLWQIESKRSQVPNVLVDFGKVLQKTRLQIERFASAAVRLPGSGRLRRSALAFLGCLGVRWGGRWHGSCAGS